MANFTRGSLLFAVTTDPSNRDDASAHSGGWSESHWIAQATNPTFWLRAVAQKRAVMLPGEASIIGWRWEQFTLTGNRLLPAGATSGRFQYPGSQGRDLNLPQDGLMVSATAVGAPNATRFNLRALPDGIILNGEYQPSPAFKGALTMYLNSLISDQWGFIGRVKTGTSSVVNKITGGVVTLQAPVGGIAETDYLILNRVYDNNGNPVKGRFLITNITGSNYTLQGLGSVSVETPSGTARIDALAFQRYDTLTPNRAVVRKIGRPFEQYRGRSSRRR